MTLDVGGGGGGGRMKILRRGSDEKNSAARGLRMLRVFYQHPKWFISLYNIARALVLSKS